jgi:hypothetical protein
MITIVLLMPAGRMWIVIIKVQQQYNDATADGEYHQNVAKS